jgi:hypothetical protein
MTSSCVCVTFLIGDRRANEHIHNKHNSNERLSEGYNSTLASSQ